MSAQYFVTQPTLEDIRERVKGYASWIEVNLDSLGHNLDQVHQRTGVEVIPCVKGNAYGHGLVPVTAYFMEHGITRFLVAKLWEAMQLREAELSCDVINMDPLFTAEQYNRIIEKGITQTVYSRKVADQLNRAAMSQGVNAGVFVKVDTGLNRVGVRHLEAANLIEYVEHLEGLHVEGIFSTFTESREKDQKQLERMIKLDEELKSRGITVPVKSLASGNAVFHFPGSELDAVRPGLMLYGIYPDKEDRESGIELKQVLTFKARLEHVKIIEEGEAVTYSARFVAPKRMSVGTFHAGYSDGVPRGLTKKGLVRFKGETRRILGTVSVNHCIVDVDGLDAEPGDIVEVVSPVGENTIEKVCELAGIMTYSYCVALNPLTPRVYMKGGVPVALSEPRLVD